MNTEMNYEQLLNQMIQFLKSKDYSKYRQKQLNSKWQSIQRFMLEKGYSNYRPLYGLEYLHEKIDYPDVLKRALTPAERDEIRAVRFLNQYLEDQTVPGSFSKPREKWNDENDAIRDAYERHCELIYDKRSTRKSRMYTATRFLQVVAVDRGINISDLNAHHISEYAMSLSSYTKSSVVIHLNGIRKFIRFLFEYGYLKEDLSAAVPIVHGGTGEKIAHVMSKENVQKLLDSIDRGSPVGKRDYAIILMSAMLGMRDSDITDLKFSSLDWERNTISFHQRKTGNEVTLPLLPNVGDAIIDYLKNGRPKTDSQYVFVRHKAPFQKATTFYGVMRQRLDDAKLKLNPDMQRGLHVLRHTLASELISQGEAYNTVSAVLGHVSLGSTQSYTHIDLDGLMKCVLDLKEVTSYEQ